MSMTPKEVIDAVTSGRAPDRLPTTVNAQSVVVRQKGLTLEQFWQLPPKEQAELTYAIARDHGGDYLHAGFNGTLAVGALGGKVKFREHGSPDVLEPLITSISELDKIDPARVRDYYYYQQAVETAKYLIPLGNGTYHVIVGSWGIYTQAGLLYGAERLLRESIRDKAAVRALLDFTFELFKACHEEVIGLGATIGSLADPSASGDMVSKRVFEELSLPYLKKTFDWFKSKGLLTTLHICGDINDRIDLIPESGTDILSVDYKVDIRRAAEILNGRVVIGGNVDPVGVILMEDPATVRKAYQDIIAALDGYPYIVMAGCGIPQSTPLENIRIINDLAHATVPSPYKVAG
ncbi:uroporphyrinogen decarboxylase [Sporobacter termitidis DSM 10068]|uniref:Uroporphyrinogen decarboxylase n=1 Tax=Sporobacter termitidis DSM 10068 TaxID=1123282 RepID=A0A1M5XFA6_9FIRM|nr:uroporphyrinogen decarboxylase family protein [Sporobacter termitidis]SHH98500.1 uroporphyrinogen decarboxylase [Sporobacter termitidis DSM 10068]